MSYLDEDDQIITVATFLMSLGALMGVAWLVMHQPDEVVLWEQCPNQGNVLIKPGVELKWYNNFDEEYLITPAPNPTPEYGDTWLKDLRDPFKREDQ